MNEQFQRKDAKTQRRERTTFFALRGHFAYFASLRLCVEKTVLSVFAFVFMQPGLAAADDFPPELVRFKQHGDKPVFTAAGSGTWEVKIRERGWIHLDPNSDGTNAAKPKYRLWYTGYDGTREGTKRLGLATSADGIAWTRHKDNPIYDQHWIEDVTVIPPVGAGFQPATICRAG